MDGSDPIWHSIAQGRCWLSFMLWMYITDVNCSSYITCVTKNTNTHEGLFSLLIVWLAWIGITTTSSSWQLHHCILSWMPNYTSCCTKIPMHCMFIKAQWFHRNQCNFPYVQKRTSTSQGGFPSAMKWIDILPQICVSRIHWKLDNFFSSKLCIMALQQKISAIPFYLWFWGGYRRHSHPFN